MARCLQRTRRARALQPHDGCGHRQMDGRMVRIGDRGSPISRPPTSSDSTSTERSSPRFVFLEKSGTHPAGRACSVGPSSTSAWEGLIALFGCEDALVLPTIALIHLAVIQVLAADGRSSSTAERTRRFSTALSSPLPWGDHEKKSRFGGPDVLAELLRQDRSTTRLITIDSVDGMTGNAPDLHDFGASPVSTTRCCMSTTHTGSIFSESARPAAKPVRRSSEQHRSIHFSRHISGSCWCPASRSRTRRLRRSSPARPS